MPRPIYPDIEGYWGISTSDIVNYLWCGARYFFSKEFGWNRVTSRMILGSAVASAAKVDNKIKMIDPTSKGASVEEVVEIAVESFRAEANASEIMDRFQEGPMIDSTASAAQAFKLNLSPSIKPILCEEPIVTKLEGEHIALRGTPDYFQEGEVIDLKTGKAWSRADVANSIQLTVYACLYREVKGEWPERVGIDSIRRVRSRVWDTERIYGERSESDFVALKHVVCSVKRGIDAGVCIPASPNQWYCSRKWCPYFMECPYVGSARRKIE